MVESEKTISETTTPQDVTDSSETPQEKRRYPWLAILSLFLCLGAWYASTVSGYATLVIGVCAIVAGAFALGSHKAAIRNTAITVIIATAVLILVVGAFMITLYKLLQ